MVLPVELPIEIVVAGAPVPKGRPRLTTINGKARSYTPSETRHYEHRVAQLSAERMDGQRPFDEALLVTISAYRAPPGMSAKKAAQAFAGIIKPTKKPDVDNYIKAALDGMNGIVYRDDSVVTDLVTRKRFAAQPRLEIRIERAPEGMA